MPVNNNNNKKNIRNSIKGNKNPRFPIWIYVILLLILLAIQFYFISPGNPNRIEYSKFLNYVKKGYVENVVIKNNIHIVGTYSQEAVNKGLVKTAKPEQTVWQMQSSKTSRNFTTTMIKGDDIRPILDKYNVSYDAKVEDDWFSGILTWLIPIGLAIAFWIFIFKRMNPGQQVLNIGKNKASLYDKQTENKVSFKDVAGLEEAKEEVEEVVEFLKTPKKFTKLGGNIPKGVLLVGPPGTGKTLLAKATAGEADVPFFSLSGSDFVEMFVGVGAARVRDLFKQAKEKAPCIIFIDEIDAIGRSRGKGMMMGSNDERENTLNQLLSEMDGFNTEKGVIIMAATNRPDVLDSALMRPGRFDRQILIDKPDLKGRVAVLAVHTKKIKMSDNVDLNLLASQTPGFAGAELANLCNEAALLAARRNKDKVEMVDFQDAIERVVAGLEKKNKLISQEERRIVAYHESGHAIVSWFLEHTDPVLKVSIVPRGLAALGYTLQTPLEDRFLMTKEELIDKICALLGGRVAEEIIFGRISTGAQNDLERVTNMSFAMVAVYGMSDEIGYLSYQDSQNPDGSFGFNKKYSEQTSEKIDAAVRKIVDECHIRTKEMLNKYKDKLEEMAQTLLKKEILDAHDLITLLGERPHGNYPISLSEAKDLKSLRNGSADTKKTVKKSRKDEEKENTSDKNEEESEKSNSSDQDKIVDNSTKPNKDDTNGEMKQSDNKKEES
ncbi:MAG TPA: ATP-dependent zinc metalloprotease FtsH [Balneolales bacterium]|nr:ATP-dependent zinc metalloprotease FtsH [Balneolales bacterium]